MLPTRCQKAARKLPICCQKAARMLPIAGDAEPTNYKKNKD
jgi:hypothetical protein